MAGVISKLLIDDKLKRINELLKTKELVITRAYGKNRIEIRSKNMQGVYDTILYGFTIKQLNEILEDVIKLIDLILKENCIEIKRHD